MTLAQSPILFTERPHGYKTVGGERLSGVTGLIKAVTGLGRYSSGVPQSALERAGEYGHAVHKAIELYEAIGVEDTVMEGNHDTYDVSLELRSYLTLRDGFTPMASEYVVGWGGYASCVDNVWTLDETGGVWLADTKTNNLRSYPGGEDALKEYLSWQLSVYAFMFEAQNPDVKVEGLVANWLRRGESKQWRIERKPDADVRRMLSVPWVYDEGADAFSYDTSSVTDLKAVPTSVAVTEALLPALPQDIIGKVCEAARVATEVKAHYDRLKKTIKEAMDAAGFTSWDSGKFKATIARDSVTEVFDAERFKAEHPELYKQYLTEKTRKGGLTIKIA